MAVLEAALATATLASKPAAAGMNAAGTNAAGTNAAGTNAAGTSRFGANTAGASAASAASAAAAVAEADTDQLARRQQHDDEFRDDSWPGAYYTQRTWHDFERRVAGPLQTHRFSGTIARGTDAADAAAGDASTSAVATEESSAREASAFASAAAAAGAEASSAAQAASLPSSLRTRAAAAHRAAHRAAPHLHTAATSAMMQSLRMARSQRRPGPLAREEREALEEQMLAMAAEWKAPQRRSAAREAASAWDMRALQRKRKAVSAMKTAERAWDSDERASAGQRSRSNRRQAHEPERRRPPCALASARAHARRSLV